MTPHLSRLRLAAASLLATALAGISGAGIAAPAADPAVQKIDRDLQALKEEAITLNRELLGIEQGLQFPDQSRSSFYVAVKVSGFLLDEISVRINEYDPVTRDYSESESRAFLKGDGWHRLLRLRLDPGSYRLQASFTGHFYDARPSDPPVKGNVETVFEKGLSELDLVLPISRNTRLDKPGLQEISRLEARKVRPSRNVWMPQPQRFETAVNADARGTLDDPRYRSAVFLKEDGRFLSALTELLDIEQSATDPATLPGDIRLLLADCYLGFGMEAQAQKRYEAIAAGQHDATTLGRARLSLARLEYQRGYYQESLDSLNRMHDAIPGALLDDWRQLVTSNLLAQERYGEVISQLTERSRIDDLTPVLRYNLAVALMKDGREAEARRELNLVGTMDVANLENLVLRDKANLSLGYLYLKAQQGQDAKTVFGRIRTVGPFSNRALLGMGWAEVAPAEAAKEQPDQVEGTATDDSLGTMLRPGYVDPKANARVPAKAPAGVTPEQQAALLRALVPWVELAKRDFMDPAVQEGMLAIPWAMDQLQDYEHSLSRYQDAINALETARKRMDEATRSIRGGRMVETIVRRDMDSEKGWTWRLRDLPDAPETYFLQTLLAEHSFQEALKNYRDSRLLTRNLDQWKARLDELERPAAMAGGIEKQIDRARRNWHPAWSGMVVYLDLDNNLGPPGAYDAPLTDTAPSPFELHALQPPPSFAGRREQLKPLRARIDALRPRTTALGVQEDDLLEKISIRELDGQKKTIEQYLTQARFAVARIYDRQLKGAQ